VVAALAVSVVSGRGMQHAAFFTAAVAVLSLAATTIKRWHTLVCLIVVLIMFVPIRRYEFRTGMPFDLEPYRILVAVVTCLWIAGLLVDRRLRLRRSGFEGPLGLFLVAILGSILTNEERLRSQVRTIRDGAPFVYPDLALASLKTLLFLLSFYAVFYVTVSVVRSEHSIHVVLKTVVGSGAIVAFFALIEFRTGYNVFNHLQSFLPLSTFEGALTAAGIARGGRLRVYASAEHPIALASMFVMLLPLAAYLWRRVRQPLWALAAVLLLLGALSTVSRTSITALAAELAVFVWLRRDSVKRLWPLLLPALLAIHIAVPGVIGSLRAEFFPSQGLANQQSAYEGRLSADRLNPQFRIIGANPAFGQGFGTRITASGPDQNAQVLDNQWLGTAVETGLVGAGAWIWFFVRFIRRSGRAAKRDPSDRGWLLTALASSVAAFAISMFTYDAFAFIQVSFILYILAALGASTLAQQGPWPSPGDTVIAARERFRPKLPGAPTR
jgi:hypothetical protein